MRSICAISNDLERTLTLFSRSHHSLALNISQTVTDTAIVTIDLNKQTHTHEIAILSLTNVTDRQKSPVFCCKKSGNPIFGGLLAIYSSIIAIVVAAEAVDVVAIVNAIVICKC